MASHIRSLYPFLSNDDLVDSENDPEDFEMLNKMRGKDLKKKIKKFSLSKNTFNDENPPQSAESNELHLVIIGKTGQGKSATANTILGKEKFKEDFTAISVTRESRCFTEVVDGRKIRVMDTPGLQDTHKSNANILKELARMTTLFPDGVHAFIYVMNMADPRFTAEDKKVLDLIEQTFGGGFKNYCLLVYSHGDSALKEVDLDTYRKRQMEIVQATSGHPTPQNLSKEQKKQAENQENLSNFLGELSWKIIAVDNSTSVPLEKAHYRKEIVAMVDHMGTLNRPEIYTNDMFVKAQQQREEMRLKGLKKGWHPSVMSIVEELLAANPSISQEQLQVEVSQYVQKGYAKKSKELKRKQEEFEKRMQEQRRIDEEKRDVEKKKRREQLEKEDKVRKETLQKVERERQEDRKRKDREHEKRLQLQLDDWETRKRAEEEDLETRRKHQQDMLEDKFREDQQRRREQEEEHLKRRKEEESTQIMQLEREAVIRRELEDKILEIKKEELERQMKVKQEEQERLNRQEEERNKIELYLEEQREERLREMEVLERNRKAKLEKEEVERQKKREQENMERQSKWEEEQAEKDQAEREKRQRAEEELHRLNQDIKNMERLQRERLLDEEVKEIHSEHENILVKSYNAVKNRAYQLKEWITDLFD